LPHSIGMGPSRSPPDALRRPPAGISRPIRPFARPRRRI